MKILFCLWDGWLTGHRPADCRRASFPLWTFFFWAVCLSEHSVLLFPANVLLPVQTLRGWIYALYLKWKSKSSLPTQNCTMKVWAAAAAAASHVCRSGQITVGCRRRDLTCGSDCNFSLLLFRKPHLIKKYDDDQANQYICSTNGLTGSAGCSSAFEMLIQPLCWGLQSRLSSHSLCILHTWWNVINKWDALGIFF